MKIVTKKIGDLIEAEYNPRQLTKEQFQQITDSIKRFGIVDPIIVNKNKERKNIIVGGHQRVKVAGSLGFKEIPCVEVNLTPDKERELNVRLNKNTGEWDWDELANHFEVSELIDWGFDDLPLTLDDVSTINLKDIEFEEEFNKIKDEHAKLPIIPEFNENHGYVLIVYDNDIDKVYIRERLGLCKSVSYNNGLEKETNIINAEWLRQLK